MRIAAGSDRRGIALPMALLAILVLTFTGAAAMAVGLQERTVAWSDATLLRARMASEAGARVAVREVLAAGDSLAAPGEWPWGREWSAEIGSGARYRTRLAPLDPEHALLESEGWAAPEQGAGHRLGRVLWRPDLDRRLRALEAILVHGGEFLRYGSARIEPDPVEEEAWLEPGGPGGEECDPYRGAVHAALEGRSPPLRHGPAPEAVGPYGEPALGRRAGAGFLRVAARTDTLSPGGTTEAEDEAGEGLPLRVAPEGLTMDSGILEGIVWARGSLVLEGDASLRGLVLVDGDLLVADEARIQGHVRVRGDVVIQGEAVLQGSGCALLRAVRGTPGARSASPPVGGGWVSLPRS